MVSRLLDKTVVNLNQASILDSQNNDHSLDIRCQDSCCKESFVTEPNKFLVGFRGRKMNPDWIHFQFKKIKYQVVSISIEGKGKIIVYFICPNGHEHFIYLAKFQRGGRCVICDKQLLHEEVNKTVHDYFEDQGYKLLSTYTDSQTKLKTFCPNGHEWWTTSSNFKSGKRCGTCLGRNKTDQDIKNVFAQRGFTLIDKEYINSHTPLGVMCPKGHIKKISLANFQRGSGCSTCSNQFISHKDVADSFAKRGFQLLSQYSSAKKPLDFLCSNGHKSSISWDRFRLGHGCGVCAKNKIPADYIKEEFEKHGYLLKSEYVNAKRLLTFICPNRHEHKISWDSFRYGSRCGLCFQDKIKHLKSFTAYSLFHRTIKKSKLPESVLLSLANDIVNIDLQDFYNKAPDGHHVDHIIPFSWFDHDNEHEIRACWSLANLRYLEATKNISRGNKLSTEEISDLTIEQIEIFNIASKKPTLV